MRRGLIARSQVELPDAVLDARLSRLRAAMARDRLDAILVYTNNTRPAGVSWLTGFVPYWSEALLVVPRAGATSLVAALTYRVKSWIERTSRLGEVLHTPRVGLGAAQKIAAGKPDAAVGIVELATLPAGIVDDLREAGPRLGLRDASALFAGVRAKADPAEIALATRAAAIAHDALAAASGASAPLGAIIAAVEARARTLGAEEIYIAAAPDLARDQRLLRIEGDAAPGQSFTLRASVAYKGCWVRLARTFFRDAASETLAEDAAAQLAEAAARLLSTDGFAGFSSWLIEGCRATQPLEALAGSRLAAPAPLVPGAIVSVQAGLRVEGHPVLAGAPVLLGAEGEAASPIILPRGA
jgi:Xaa-Pro aminopeptidase